MIGGSYCLPTISIGDTVRDTPTGVEGVVLAMTFYQYRTPLVMVVREGVKPDGSPWDEWWVDADRLVAAS